jgi:hypothetical protein
MLVLLVQVLPRDLKKVFSFFSNNAYTSEFATPPPPSQAGHSFDKMQNSVQFSHFSKEGSHTDAIKKVYIYKETVKNRQINDKHERYLCEAVVYAVIGFQEDFHMFYTLVMNVLSFPMYVKVPVPVAARSKA